MYYKVIFDGSVIDALDGLQYVTQTRYSHGLIGTSDEAKAMGVLSSNCSEVWHVDTMLEFYDGDYKTVRVVEISEDEYNELRDELAENGMLDDDSGIANEEPHEQESVAKSPLLRRVEELSEQLDFLTECLLEMSEVVYE